MTKSEFVDFYDNVVKKLGIRFVEDKGFIRLHGEKENTDYTMPETYHNISFLDTIIRSLFFANQLNSLSTPLLANIFFLLEKCCNSENKDANK